MVLSLKGLGCSLLRMRGPLNTFKIDETECFILFAPDLIYVLDIIELSNYSGILFLKPD